MSLSEDQVRHVARLARIDLSPEEIQSLGKELSDILAYAEQVGEVAADDVPPTSHPYPLANVHRIDEPHESLPREQTLANAPAEEDDRFRVPQIVGEDT